MNTRESDFWTDRSTPRFAPEHFNEIVATAADLAIIIDLKGIVQSLVVNPLNPGLGRLDHWVKRDIREFLAEDSLPKVERQLDAYRRGEAESLDTIEVNHYDNANWEFPIRYTLHRTGDKDMILMLGRDMRPIAELQTRLVKTQLALEKDYEAHRDFETRYRVVMETTRDPFVLVDAASGRIIDANSAAGLVLGAEVEALVGASFGQEFDGKRPAAFLDSLIASAGGSSASTPLLTVQSRRSGRDMTITAVQFRAAGDRVLLCRLETGISPEVVGEDLALILSNLYRDGADAMVVTDRSGMIRFANDAFLSLLEAAQLSDVKGTSFSDYLGRGSVDLRVLIDNATRSGRMSIYSTRLEGHHGSKIAIEISATSLTGRADQCFGFVIRDASRMELIRGVEADLPSGLGDAAMQNVMDLVGSAPLKDIVAATTDVVEKMCIETAVELTSNNRVAAAEMLGLSRQSLYVKLRKYGLLNKGD